jgi:pimeloyl-ACP methyl ester carboxylesterase
MPYALINGQNIFFEDSQGLGIPIIMMHGFLMDQSLFDPQVQVLAPHYRCIRFDARAFGQTQWDRKPFSLYDTVADCLGLMDFLDIKQAVIAGMSQGGYAALRLALMSPQRVMALILMSTQGGIDGPDFRAQCEEIRDIWKEKGPQEPILEALASALLGPKESPEMAKHWDIWLLKWRNYSGEAIFHAMNNLLNRDDIMSKIPEIKHPALVSHGDADFGIPWSLGHLLSQKLPNCLEMLTIPHAAHAANYTHPSVLNNILLKFLAHMQRDPNTSVEAQL